MRGLAAVPAAVMRALGIVGLLAVAPGATLSGSFAGCASHEAATGPSQAADSAQPAAASGSCPAELSAPLLLPGVEAEHRRLEYWLTQVGSQQDLDAVVLTPEQMATHNAALAAVPGRPARGHLDLLAPESMTELRAELEERFAYLRERIASDEYRGAEDDRLPEDDRKAVAPLTELPPLGPTELRVALEPVPIRCAPFAHPLFKVGQRDKRFDRNNCSALRAQEPVRVLGSWPGGMRLVRSATSIGFVPMHAKLSAPLDEPTARQLLHSDGVRVSGPAEVTGPRGARLAVSDRVLLRLAQQSPPRVWFATRDGMVESEPLPPSQVLRVARPMTRRAVLEEAWTYLDTPYGWGDQGGGRDCSRFLMDVFDSFGLELPRHSGVQAQAGSFSVELGTSGSERERLAIIDAAAARGIVLLHFPGHIMLYLGRSAEGRPMVMHAFAEYLAPCGAGPAAGSAPLGSAAAPSPSAAAPSPSAAAPSPSAAETLFRVDRVQVSDLELGRGSSRRSFLERITHVVVLGKGPGPALAGVAVSRPAAPQAAAAPCPEHAASSLLVSPRRPSATEPLRVVATSRTELGPTELVLVGPDGTRHQPPVHEVGGPPYGLWTALDAPTVGRWEARLGEGNQLTACEAFEVRARPAGRQAGDGAVWRARARWSERYEELYAVFVEQLFAYPASNDDTWPNLQTLLRERDKNILFDHLGQDEDTRLTLEPDCADMPYFLRAYFAWKLRLPVGHRRCNRGRADAPPTCDRDIEGNIVERAARDEVEAFAQFARVTVGDGVHSGNTRTGPTDDRTDLYPVALQRESLRPGVVFADPYGHVLMVAGWQPQGISESGGLIGAESQPDGTIGRRRFWRGSFLFTPETTTAGAGFKAFRPLRARGEGLRSVRNADIGAEYGPLAWSDEQYRGSTNDFYDRMDELINPRALEPEAVLGSLVGSLLEAAERRVLSVDNGEQYVRSHRGVIDMPEGHAIFETTGPWEDYATPSRDMRLLIAMDTVLAFPGRVGKRPARFGIAAGAEASRVVTELGAALDRELGARQIRYHRSDGTEQSLTLRELVDRASRLEMAYNPNDCVEVRWGAPEGGGEQASCQRHAPAEQRRRMESYRQWFADRSRPARSQ